MLRDRSDVAAYAAYRMPATFEAVRAALAAFRARTPAWAPATHIDIGGGTGAASWAVAATWPRDGHTTTVLDWAEPALALGRELAGQAPSEALRTARWERRAIRDGLALPDGTDLVTVSYVLGELTEADRRAVVTEAARAAQAVVLIEPGTPDGYLRIREARDRLLAAGLRIVAPARTARPARSSPAPTGATSPPGSAAPPSTGRSRAVRCRTRTRSSAMSRPYGSTPRPPTRGWCAARRSARARYCWTCAPRGGAGPHHGDQASGPAVPGRPRCVLGRCLATGGVQPLRRLRSRGEPIKPLRPFEERGPGRSPGGVRGGAPSFGKGRGGDRSAGHPVRRRTAREPLDPVNPRNP
ncbi:small ribosomal subunit Rsm22 [Streptomyces melanosporofaciens]|uniref:Small ribosomal subunit Rsm22 n=1 Tax=Streptomyces melanosporofaciens TaxID=67327 RepID=A0A1H4M943_STRMJ|nr:small ribosomal subunit Rsm22 [Streptomyces melanosporofaciens]